MNINMKRVVVSSIGSLVTGGGGCFETLKGRIVVDGWCYFGFCFLLWIVCFSYNLKLLILNLKYMKI
jgi:hypothetical protein